jgi:hypothetical protein
MTKARRSAQNRLSVTSDHGHLQGPRDWAQDDLSDWARRARCEKERDSTGSHLEILPAPLASTRATLPQLEPGSTDG